MSVQPASGRGATLIMVIRHGEKPDSYDGQEYAGVNATGSSCGKDAAEHLVTLGWQRAGGLVSLFTQPWGPRSGLATPTHLYAADPDATSTASPSQAQSKDDGPSQRPYETLTPLAARLGLTINTTFSKGDYGNMIADALQRDVVLICWQHQDIPLENGAKQPGISQLILTQTGTSGTMSVPETWPKTPGPKGTARYDLVFVFSRPSGIGPITSFAVVPQFLLAGDLPWTSGG